MIDAVALTRYALIRPIKPRFTPLTARIHSLPLSFSLSTFPSIIIIITNHPFRSNSIIHLFYHVFSPVHQQDVHPISNSSRQSASCGTR